MSPSVHLSRGGFNGEALVPLRRMFANPLLVTEDLVRYMASAMSDGSSFLVDDPVWAEDFAPNGTLDDLRVLFELDTSANIGVTRNLVETW